MFRRQKKKYFIEMFTRIITIKFTFTYLII